MRVSRATRGDRRGARVSAKAHHPVPRTRPGGNPAEHGRTPNPRQRWIVERQGVARLEWNFSRIIVLYGEIVGCQT